MVKQKNKYINSNLYAILLNLLFPGLGHLYFKEIFFGLFIFLVTLIAVILFFVSFFVPLSGMVKFILFGLPIVFYLFTFIDLIKTKKNKQNSVKRSKKTSLIFVLIGVMFQVLAPVAPGNFILRNMPEYFFQENNEVSPIFTKGDLLSANSLSYITDLFFLEQPVFHALPERYDIVRYTDENKRDHTGIVVGLPSEEIEILDGIVVINGMPDYEGTKKDWSLTGQSKLTLGDEFSIIVISLSYGTIEKSHVVPLQNLIGKVEKFL